VCNKGTKSPYGVCEPCPIGAITDDAKTQCIDENECAVNEGGCDPLALFSGGPCINEDPGYRCGTCPDGFVPVPTFEDFYLTREATHGELFHLVAKRRANGSRCDLPPPPPPPEDGSLYDPGRDRVTVLPTVEIELNHETNTSLLCTNKTDLARIHEHISASIGVQMSDLDAFHCTVKNTPGGLFPMLSPQLRRLEGAVNVSNDQNVDLNIEAWATVTFTLRSVEMVTDIKELLRQLNDASSVLHSTNDFVPDNWETARRTIPLFQCPAGSTLADSRTFCARCAVGKFNPKPGGMCTMCPPSQTSTKPFHSCHCEPGTFNASYVNIRCFEPGATYFPSYVLNPEKRSPNCYYVRVPHPLAFSCRPPH